MLRIAGLYLAARASLLTLALSGEPWPYSCAAGDTADSFHFDLAGKTLLVTGSDGRLGFELSLAAARAGGTVVAACRTAEKAAATKDLLEAQLNGTGRIEPLVLDLSSFSSVRAGAASLAASHPAIDVVAHVAGVAGHDEVTEDGLIGTGEINVLAPALLTNLLLPSLRRAASPRVVYIGSMAAYNDMGWPEQAPLDALWRWLRGEEKPPVRSYGLTKFLDIHYAAEQALRLKDVSIFSVNPGYFRDPPSEYTCPSDVLFRPCPQSPAQGAASTFFAAAQPGIEAETGAMFDFETDLVDGGFTQSGDSCVPRKLPVWDSTIRAQWYDDVQGLIGNSMV